MGGAQSGHLAGSEGPQNPDDDGDKPGRLQHTVPHRFWTRKKQVAVAVIAIMLFILALGLGLGCGLGKGCALKNTTYQPDSSLPGGGGGGGGGESGPPASLWKPAANTTWQIVLSRPIKMESPTYRLAADFEVYDIDLFENTDKGKSTATIDNLHRQGKKVICYFSAGSYEPYRPDSDQFTSDDLGADLEGWPGEKWLDLRSDNVARIMKARIQLAAKMGCDAIDPDNMDAYVGSSPAEGCDVLRVPVIC